MGTSKSEIGERIISARTRVGMSQSDLATACGLSLGTINAIETGDRSASYIEATLIADALGIYADELRGTSTLLEEALCTGCAGTAGSKKLADYLVSALALSQRLDEIGIPG
ncbi:helix-turn-helix domain-containing protein [Actinotignum sp. GS-2025f]|uniref:helix-turn-helix domain-containing protein n=1 Tax=Actinotignum TaxID=1653174 RepID=UPI00373FC5F0